MIMHAVRELWKITEIRHGDIYGTKSLGLWYVPLDTNMATSSMATAKELGGDQWGSPSTSWCRTHNNDIFRAFKVAGYYRQAETK